jgi:hypothetical protein
MSGLIRTLCDELLDEFADVAPPAPYPVPESKPVGTAARYLGRYELRNETAEVTVDKSSRLRLSVTQRNEAAGLARLAGSALETETAELRRVEGETFVRVDDAGQAVGVVEFIDADDAGRARYLHTGRAAPRARRDPEHSTL